MSGSSAIKSCTILQATCLEALSLQPSRSRQSPPRQRTRHLPSGSLSTQTSRLAAFVPLDHCATTSGLAAEVAASTSSIRSSMTAVGWRLSRRLAPRSVMERATWPAGRYTRADPCAWTSGVRPRVILLGIDGDLHGPTGMRRDRRWSSRLTADPGCRVHEAADDKVPTACASFFPAPCRR